MTQDMNDLERDIEESRARLDLTIDRLQDKLSVSGIVDDVLGSTRKNSYGPVFDNALEVIKRNPVPVMLVAAGVGWLLVRMSQGSVRTYRTPHLRYADPVDAPVIDGRHARLYDPDVPLQTTPAESLELGRELNARA
jgi:hypothetical protein